ncbi:hypothetical protein FC756_26650, partial [Lysinibacillus mangiferihumi]
AGMESAGAKFINKGAKAFNGVVDGIKTVTNKGPIGQLKEKATKQLDTVKDKFQTKVAEVKDQFRQLGTPQLELAGVNMSRITDTGTVGKNKPTPNPPSGTGYSGKLPSQGTVDAGINGAPKVDAGKQGKHVPGHGNNVSTKSQWSEGQNGVQLTQEAWMNGTPVRADGSVKTYDFGTPVGPNGETRVKVHIDKKGNIHGYPVQ